MILKQVQDDKVVVFFRDGFALLAMTLQSSLREGYDEVIFLILVIF
ncbi:hypothetical protein [Aestuariibaculum marinum]|uniref:Uncharacterized protein n=1 Tax=Aestuariibaculum marinum TaxID=2683592 RepID=A0A8J6PTF5_9FLAO|nr:hypothetical protein [Aestuariibaculum marinum]MBD0823028.1 hypothetical protein [Aestuariibaculum marinum]